MASANPNYCSKEVEVAVLATRVEDLERRCDIKEKAFEALKKEEIKPMRAWQERAIGYSIVFSFLASLVGNYIAVFLK